MDIKFKMIYSFYSLVLPERKNSRELMKSSAGFFYSHVNRKKESNKKNNNFERQQQCRKTPSTSSAQKLK